MNIVSLIKRLFSLERYVWSIIKKYQPERREALQSAKEKRATMLESQRQSLKPHISQQLDK